MKPSKRRRKFLVIVSVLAYLVSMGLPIHHSGGGYNNDGYMIGLLALLFGALGGFMSIVPIYAGFSWFANPFYLLSFLPMSYSKKRVAATLAVGAALLFFAVAEVPINEAGGMLASDPGVGFYVWLSAFLLRLFSLFPSQTLVDTKDTDLALSSQQGEIE